MYHFSSWYPTGRSLLKRLATSRLFFFLFNLTPESNLTIKNLFKTALPRTDAAFPVNIRTALLW
jgi:hypothetical protein